MAIMVGLAMSAVALDTDLLRVAGYKFQRRDPSNRMRGWKSATAALETMRGELETRLGEKLFLIADARDRASEISFYLRDKRVEGPGHPPVYIPESQDMVNQFSFWPRYDEFVELKPGAPLPEGEVYTEESGIDVQCAERRGIRNIDWIHPGNTAVGRSSELSAGEIVSVAAPGLVLESVS
jgi:hypothetical protein